MQPNAASISLKWMLRATIEDCGFLSSALSLDRDVPLIRFVLEVPGALRARWFPSISYRRSRPGTVHSFMETVNS